MSEQGVPAREIRSMLRAAWGPSKYIEFTSESRTDWYKDYVTVLKWLKEVEQLEGEHAIPAHGGCTHDRHVTCGLVSGV